MLDAYAVQTICQAPARTAEGGRPPRSCQICAIDICAIDICAIDAPRKSPGLPGCRRAEEALAERPALLHLAPPTRQPQRSRSLDRGLKQTAVFLVVNETGTRSCNFFSISSGTNHAADSSRQCVKGRPSNDRTLSRNSRLGQRRNLRRPRAGCLPHGLRRGAA